jgi:hypothetical protein
VGVWFNDAALAIFNYNWTFPKGVLVAGLMRLFTHRLIQSRQRTTEEPTIESLLAENNANGAQP